VKAVSEESKATFTKAGGVLESSDAGIHRRSRRLQPSPASIRWAWVSLRGEARSLGGGVQLTGRLDPSPGMTRGRSVVKGKPRPEDRPLAAAWLSPHQPGSEDWDAGGVRADPGQPSLTMIGSLQPTGTQCQELPRQLDPPSDSLALGEQARCCGTP